jgi:hypothetical protein
MVASGSGWFKARTTQRPVAGSRAVTHVKPGIASMAEHASEGMMAPPNAGS